MRFVMTGRLSPGVRGYIHTRLNDVDVRNQLTEEYLQGILAAAALVYIN
jgi:hypothetical protein